LTLNKKLHKGDGQGGGDYSSAKLLQSSPYAAGPQSYRSENRLTMVGEGGAVDDEYYDHVASNLTVDPLL